MNMNNEMSQIKFTIESSTISAFKSRCSKEGVSMTSVIRKYMQTCQPVRDVKTRTDTRPMRKKAVIEIIGLLNDILFMEEKYRDSIPEQFAQRFEAAEHACEQISEAIALLLEAFQ